VVGNDTRSRIRVPGKIQRIGLVVIVRAIRHVDDDRLGRPDVFPAVVQIGRDNQEAGIFFADHKFIQRPTRG